MTIKQLLLDLNIVTEDSLEIFSRGTRDDPTLTVYRDKTSGVIFIDDFYVGDDEYSQGIYKLKTQELTKRHTGIRDYTACLDLDRRTHEYRQFFVGKSIIDFGCGTGAFLRSIQPYTTALYGIELQDSFRESLLEDGIDCFSSIDAVPDKSIDTIFLFHSFEHLPNPLIQLKQLCTKLKSGGKIVVEVPHAKDFLISHLQLSSFIDFTLWSQHLILHTRSSLNKFLDVAQFTDITITGVQRFPLSNHLQWLLKSIPGGHQSPLSIIDNSQLTSAYSEALAGLDANDTLLAVANFYD